MKHIHMYFNGYPTNTPSPLKSSTYERTKKFKCPVHSCTSLVVITQVIVSTLYNGLWSDSRSGPLPNNVLMYVMNSIFLATLWSSKPSLFVFILSNWPFSRNILWSMSSTNSPKWEPLSLCHDLLLKEVYLWQRASYENFLAVYLAPDPLTHAHTHTHTHACTWCVWSIFNTKRD
jgi:hypothetical protein